jgi:hypothetical protein
VESHFVFVILILCVCDIERKRERKREREKERKREREIQRKREIERFVIYESKPASGVHNNFFVTFLLSCSMLFVVKTSNLN